MRKIVAGLFMSLDGVVESPESWAYQDVVSATLDSLEWGPASLITGDVAGEIAKLKRRPGKNIQVPGSPALVRWLLCGGLLEDTTGQVRRTVAESKTFTTGAVGVTYQPEIA